MKRCIPCSLINGIEVMITKFLKCFPAILTVALSSEVMAMDTDKTEKTKRDGLRALLEIKFHFTWATQ
jgi:hypothetical protein